MEKSLLNKFNKSSIKNVILFLGLSTLVGASGVIAASSNTYNRTKNINAYTQALAKTETLIASSTQELIPMPSGQIDTALTTVESTRDPFQEAPVTESSNIDLLRAAIEFNGIAKSGKTLVAIIKTEEGQMFYKIGDKLGNGFIIENISEAEITTDISNGIKRYRLSLEKFKVRQ